MNRTFFPASASAAATPVSPFGAAVARASLRTAALAAGLFLIVGCASVPLPPTEAIQAAEQAIATAEKARVADFASPELGEARDKLAAAHAAVREEKMVLAQRLAEQSRAEADLAVAKSAAANAKVVNDEMRKSTEAIEQEMQRNSGAR